MGWNMKGAGLALLLIAGPVAAQTRLQTSAGEMVVTPVAAALEGAWSFGFLPGGALIVTEIDGRLLILRAGQASPVSGLPEITALGQGGLLDVMVPRDFERSRQIWLSYVARSGEGLALRAGFGRLSEDFTRLEGFEPVFEGESLPASRHFGARLVEGRDGRIWLTTGDRGTGPAGMEAQDPGLATGSVILLNRDGSPGVTRPGWRPGVWSVGHRNIQAAGLDLQGALVTSEHGAQGGDEINRPGAGLNYGWPVISYGVNYNGRKIGEGQARAGMEQPLHYWDPSIAPSGLMVYSGALIPEWRGDIFAGSLKMDFISRLDPDQAAPTGWAEERIASEETLRVRDLREGPDGAIWFLSEGNGALYRLAPPE